MIFLCFYADKQLREEKRKNDDIDVGSNYTVDHNAKKIRLENTFSQAM